MTSQIDDVAKLVLAVEEIRKAFKKSFFLKKNYAFAI